jgi:hypothetical protein
MTLCLITHRDDASLLPITRHPWASSANIYEGKSTGSGFMESLIHKFYVGRIKQSDEVVLFTILFNNFIHSRLIY